MEDPEALRRRLYAPGASDADRARFEAADREAAPVEPGPAAPPPAEFAPERPARSRRRRAVVPVGVAAVVLAVVLGGLTAVRLAEDGRPSGPSPAPVAMTDEDRRSVRENLTLGNYGGIAAFLVTHQALRLGHPTRIETVERKGTGDAVVSLSPVSAQAVQGRATVLLVLAGSGQAEWTTLRRRVDASGEQQVVQQVQRGGFQEGGQITTHTYRYSRGDRPVELHVSVPDGVRWGAAVVFTD